VIASCDVDDARPLLLQCCTCRPPMGEQKLLAGDKIACPTGCDKVPV
jgi:hypothetical protein